ncbi:hypothetical protein SAMN05660485_02562 [Blastococcus fimeti]|nr:hypothetical protein SAMN05660485_02562 [Blastococcus fimeti]
MTRQRIRRTLLTLTAVVATAVLATPAEAAPYCGITWGSQPEVGAGAAPAGAALQDVRAGRHACFDRLVVQVGHARGFSGYDVRYVPAVSEDGSGRPVPLRGGAAMQVIVRTADHDEAGRATYTPRSTVDVVSVRGFTTLRQVAWAGAFEGQATLGVGTRARLPFRVFTLAGPGSADARVVIDVAHRW